MPLAWIFLRAVCGVPPPQKRYAHTRKFFYAQELPPKRTRASDAHRLPPHTREREREKDECLLFFSRSDFGGRGCVPL